MYQVKIKVRPNQAVRFPGICIHCAHPALAVMPIKKRLGRITRIIDVPLCTNCAGLLLRRSDVEARYQRMGIVATIGVFLFVGAVGLIMTPVQLALIWRLFAALATAVLCGTAVWLICRYLSRRAALPEKQAILKTAQIARFTWRTTTFNFSNQAFYERFISINQSLVT